MREKILNWIDRESEELVALIRTLVQARSPNPPGDTRETMDAVRAFLDARAIPYDLHVRDETMPNLVATHAFGEGERHLVLNGHIDVFPADEAQGWSVPPWEAQLVDGAIYGRGVADMKVGTTASIATFLCLAALGEGLKGRLTLTVVSDEETFGPNGARHLFDSCPDLVTGTACLNGEPSSAETVRFGEKGACWLRFTVTTPGGHGAYPHVSPNAIDVAMALVADLRRFTETRVTEPPEVVAALEASREAYDRGYGAGASAIARSVTMNVGTMKAGPKVNMIASICQFELDVRLPIGMRSADLFTFIEGLKSQHSFGYDKLMVNEPNWVTPDNDLTAAVKRNAKEIVGIEPMDVTSLGNTDARLWRYRDIPAVIYGPAPRGMGSFDENVPVKEALDIVRVHALSAYDYLAGGR